MLVCAYLVKVKFVPCCCVRCGQINVHVCVCAAGVGYPTVYQYMCACALFHGRLGLMHQNPARLRAVTESLREMRENHAIEHTTVLDVLEDLPFIRRAIFNSSSLCDGEKLMWWSLVTSSSTMQIVRRRFQDFALPRYGSVAGFCTSGATWVRFHGVPQVA